jgi:hypothetical protein
VFPSDFRLPFYKTAKSRLHRKGVFQQNRPNPASGERQVSGTPSGIRGCLTRGLLAIVGAETVFRTEIATIGQRGRAVGRLSVDADVDPPVDQRVVRVIGGRKNLRRPVGNVDDPSQESKRVLRGVRARIACPVS